MKVRNFLVYILFLIIPFRSVLATCSDEYALIVYDEDNQKILEQRRASELKYPASLVKLMTLYLTFEAIEDGKINMNTALIASDRVAEQWKFNADLVVGDTLTVKQAILGVIVKSFNDFAVFLAEAVGESEWNFVRLMNKKAKELRLENTHFRNATGFTETNQLTTARDMLKLTQALKKDFPQYYSLFSRKSFWFKGKKYKTHNHVLQDYKWAKGMKTGFTRASGYNLITTASKNGKNLTAIVISCSVLEDRDDFVISVLNKHYRSSL